MNLQHIAHIRLMQQQIAAQKFHTTGELLSYMGAMQAQDFAMVQWAIGMRLTGASQSLTEAALNTGEVIRTHLLRPTWHVVSADDIYWMLALTAPHIIASMRYRHKQLEITPEATTRAFTAIENSFLHQPFVSRQTLVLALQQARISTDDNRAAHLLMLAELQGLLCSGEVRGRQQTYALLPERVPHKKEPSREEALYILARRYFSSHGPASLHDFVWWSGLPIREARQALFLAEKDLIQATADQQTYYFEPSHEAATTLHVTACLLPAFDEYLISYKDRSAAVTSPNHSRAVSRNGIFWPVILLNGQVAGTWKRTFRKDTVEITASSFQPLSGEQKEAIEKAAQAFGSFLGKQLLLFFH